MGLEAEKSFPPPPIRPAPSQIEGEVNHRNTDGCNETASQSKLWLEARLVTRLEAERSSSTPQAESFVVIRLLISVSVFVSLPV